MAPPRPLGAKKLGLPVVVRDRTIEAVGLLRPGERINYCCAGCDKRLTANAGSYAKNLEKQGIIIDVEKVEKASKVREGF